MDNITILNSCDDEEFLQKVRINGLLKYNMEHTGGKINIPDREIIRIARNENGDIVGGASGSTYLSSLEVEVLWVSEECREQNIASQLLKELEAEAKELSCVLAHLTTYSFQAPEFYEKQGYVVCGEIDGFPDNIKLYTLKKKL